MSNHETFTAKLLEAFNLDADKADPAAVASAAASVLIAFAEVVRGPALQLGELVAVECAASANHDELLVELRKQNTLLEVIAKQGERTLQYIESASRPVCGGAACGLAG
jgi:hypothetical protein